MRVGQSAEYRFAFGTRVVFVDLGQGIRLSLPQGTYLLSVSRNRYSLESRPGAEQDNTMIVGTGATGQLAGLQSRELHSRDSAYIQRRFSLAAALRTD